MICGALPHVLPDATAQEAQAAAGTMPNNLTLDLQGRSVEVRWNDRPDPANAWTATVRVVPDA
jgi:hypothetical protein